MSIAWLALFMIHVKGLQFPLMKLAKTIHKPFDEIITWHLNGDKWSIIATNPHLETFVKSWCIEDCPPEFKTLYVLPIIHPNGLHGIGNRRFYLIPQRP